MSAYHHTRRLFLRSLALCYAVAFVSLWTQIQGLYGSEGILPINDHLAALYERSGASVYRSHPSLLWLLGGDVGLHVVCGLGTAASVALFFGLRPRLAAFGAWACYLSLVTVSRVFLSFQWDTLLLETGFLAVLLAHSSSFVRDGAWRPPSLILIGLFRWLLFRLMFTSGLAKLTSNDPSWWDLTALRYHYETQPLPAWTSWYAHNLPDIIGRFSVGTMFAIELVVPFLIFAPRRVRLFAFFPLAALQVAIAVTGNYGFFNYLTLALCLLLLDDGFLHRLAPARWPLVVPGPAPTRPHVVTQTALALMSVALVVLGSAQMIGRCYGAQVVPTPIRHAVYAVQPYHITHGYGLFAGMTKTRPEIVIDGSADGDRWLPYVFRWKPGDLNRRPRFVAPHQPRLDWQMWFAALGGPYRNQWVVALQRRLMEASPSVLALLGENPFPDGPPRYIRVSVYDYRMTDAQVRRTTGAWWTRDKHRTYVRTIQRGALVR